MGKAGKQKGDGGRQIGWESSVWEGCVWEGLYYVFEKVCVSFVEMVEDRLCERGTYERVVCERVVCVCVRACVCVMSEQT